jgi:hypothetical protein
MGGYAALHNLISIGGDLPFKGTLKDVRDISDVLRHYRLDKNKYASFKDGRDQRYNIHYILWKLYGVAKFLKKVHDSDLTKRLLSQKRGRFMVLVGFQDQKLGWLEHWISVIELRGSMVIIDGMRKTNLVLSEAALKQRKYEEVVEMHQLHEEEICFWEDGATEIAKYVTRFVCHPTVDFSSISLLAGCNTEMSDKLRKR